MKIKKSINLNAHDLYGSNEKYNTFIWFTPAMEENITPKIDKEFEGNRKFFNGFINTLASGTLFVLIDNHFKNWKDRFIMIRSETVSHEALSFMGKSK